ncbi:hypothetical protein [Nocardioides sp. 503]|uniref:hypothetical protein n=1 Tax=Nocardioides sp. 503 TaxID=2508326 RepID=UPI001ADA442D|nr:hypothetical protein [Nocardioides sp. 503]
MTSLHDRLADLAESASQDASSEDGDLWERGLRYSRRRRLETVVLTLVILGAVGSLVGALLPAATYEVGPADAQAALRLPDRIEHPSGWTKDTGDVGPIGPLVAIVPSERKTGLLPRSSEDLVAVSVDGDYAFLELPGRSDRAVAFVSDVVLSPDGRRIVYWLTGDTSKEPNLSAGDGVVGVAVYDTVTGEVQRHEVPTAHGLSPMSLATVGDRVWMEYGQWQDGAPAADGSSLSTKERQYVWDLGSGDVSRRPESLSGPMGATTWQDRLVVPTSRGAIIDDGEPGDTARRLRLGFNVDGPVALNPSGSRVVATEDRFADGDRSTLANPLRHGVVAPAGDAVIATTEVDGTRGEEVVGWRDDWHVVVREYETDQGPALVSIDVNTGAREELVALPSQSNLEAILWAQDALQAPVFDADSPPYVMPPWLQGSLLLLAGVLSFAGLRLWRRRERV